MTQNFDPEAHAEAMAVALGLTIPPEWKPTVVANVKATAAAAELLLAMLFVLRAPTAPSQAVGFWTGEPWYVWTAGSVLTAGLATGARRARHNSLDMPPVGSQRTTKTAPSVRPAGGV